MDSFAHLSVLISIVLGLGITNLLMGLARVVQLRGQVKVYWPVILWALTLLVIHIQTWWSMFGLRFVKTWDFVSFTLTLAQPILLFFLSALLMPDFDRDEARDLRRNYFLHVRWFFGIFMALLIVSIARTYVLAGRLTQETDLVFHAFFFLSSLAAAIVERSLSPPLRRARRSGDCRLRRAALHASALRSVGFCALGPQSPLSKNENCCQDQAGEASDVVPFDCLAEIEHRKNSEDDERHHFLDGFELCRRIDAVTPAISRNREAILDEGDTPTYQDHDPQRLVLELQMPVPGKGHEHVGYGKQDNRQDYVERLRHVNSRIRRWNLIRISPH